MKSLAAFIFIGVVPSLNWCELIGQNGTESGSNLFQMDTDVLAEADRAVSIMPNIGYLFRGYDIMEGNPLSTKPVDPGFRQPIFKAEYKSNKMTPDQRYLEPDGTSIQDCSGDCSLTFSTTEITSSKSYQESLENIVSSSVGGTYEGFGAKFSASVGFKDVEERTSSHSSLFTQSSASCCSYWAQTLTYNPPPMSENFLTAIGHLPNDYDETAYFRFIQTFGTHFIKEARLGALFGQQSELSKDSWTSMKAHGRSITVEAEASVNMVIYSAEASVKNENTQQKNASEAFAKASTKQKIFTIGAVPPSDMKVSSWLQQTKSAPEPMKLKLGSIMELFENNETNITETVKDNIQKGLKDYCEMLRGYGVVKSCSVLGEGGGYEDTSSITFPEKLVGADYWGDWGPVETCQFPHFANKMELKIQKSMGGGYASGRDDTALNAIRLTCTDGTNITSSYQQWGDWQGVKVCPVGTFIQKARMRREINMNDGDETSANGIRFKCTNIPEQVFPGDGHWGDWSEWQSCAEGSAVYGIQTRVQVTTKDNTALNDVKFLCAKLSDREKPRFVQVSSSEETFTAQKDTMGTYELQTNETNNHPVWKKDNLYLYVSSDEVWAIGKDMNSTSGDLFLDKKPAPQLPGPGPWKFYYTDHSDWKQDQTLSVETLTGIPVMRCNGINNGCCTEDNPCQEGDGDCDTDSQCDGDLKCGENNCPWGNGDDCCKREVCSAGKEFMGNCYELVKSSTSWESAAKACKTRGGALAEIPNSQVNKYLADLAVTDAWIGGTDSEHEGAWKWTTREDITYTNWSSGQPDDANGREDCLEINFKVRGKWNDGPCSTKLHYICQFPVLK